MSREIRESPGEVEFTTDGTVVNTTEGWRETKLAIFSKPELGAGATREEWATRTLPAPKVRVAFAAIEASDRFDSRSSQWCLPAAEGMLDIFHAVEQVAERARAVFGEGTAEAKQWLAAGCTTLLVLRKAARPGAARSRVPARI